MSSSSAANLSTPAFLRQSRSDIQTKFIDLEWQQRERLSEGLRTPQPYLTTQTPTQEHSKWARHTGDDVSARNRYLNVDPFASNRVHLQVPKGQSDYINASPIRIPPYKQLQQTQDTARDGAKQSGSNDQEEHYYIATQGPKEDSHSHIYRMIHQQTADGGPAVIIMLTQTHESGREKCFQYYPSSLQQPTMPINESDEFKDDFHATLRLLSITEDSASRSTIREMSLEPTNSANGPPKKIWHLLFAGWPDFLVPEGQDKAALIQLLLLSKEKNNNSPTNPRIVHCSAGVGRSGTFIALDWLLDELDAGAFDHLNEQDDPIAEVVDHLRQQRMMMVQGESQFLFLYEVMREKFKERLQRLQGSAASHSQAQSKSKVIQTVNDSDNGDGSDVANDSDCTTEDEAGNVLGGTASGDELLGGSVVSPVVPPSKAPLRNESSLPRKL